MAQDTGTSRWLRIQGTLALGCRDLPVIHVPAVFIGVEGSGWVPCCMRIDPLSMARSSACPCHCCACTLQTLYTIHTTMHCVDKVRKPMSRLARRMAHGAWGEALHCPLTPLLASCCTCLTPSKAITILPHAFIIPEMSTFLAGSKSTPLGAAPHRPGVLGF